MAEFQKVMADAKRMYAEFDDPNHPIYIGAINVEKFESTVQQWAAFHPVKTNRMVMQEVFPINDIDQLCIRLFTPVSHEDCEKTDCTHCRNKWFDSEYKGGEGNG